MYGQQKTDVRTTKKLMYGQTKLMYEQQKTDARTTKTKVRTTETGYKF